MIALDPLGGHADPRLYVALDSGESVLAAIGMGLKAGCSPVLLSGPTGLGKTLLLRVLAEREWKSFPRMRFSPRLPLEPDDVAGCLLHLLFGKLPPGGPAEAEVALLEELRIPGDRRTLLLVDNIQRATEASIRKLVELLQASAPALAIVAAGTSGGDLHALVETLAPGLIVSLPESLPDPEIEALYEAIFAHPGLSQRLRHRLARASRDEIRGAAAGSPRLLKNELARYNQDRPVPARQLPTEEPPGAERDPAPVAGFTDFSPETIDGIVARSVAEFGALEEPEHAPRLRLHLVPAAPVEVRDAEPHAASPVTGLGRWTVPLLALLIFGSAARGAAAAAQRAWTMLRRSAADALGHAAPRLGEWLVAVECAARGAGNEVVGMATWSMRSATDAVSDAAARLGEVAMAAECAARVAVESGHGKLTHMQTATRALRRWAAEEVGPSASRLVESAAASRRAAGAWFPSAYGRFLRSGTESVRGAKQRLLAGARANTARMSRGLGTAARRTDGLVRRSVTAPSRFARSAADRGRTVGRAALRIAPTAALPATALLALTLLPLGQHASDAPKRPGIVVAAVEPVAAVTPSDASARTPAPAPSVDVQVNARPWARVSINGVDAGPTPLRQRLAPGTYQLEARFPDGQTIQREIDVDGERRFVSLP